MKFNKWLEHELEVRHLSIQAFSNKSGLARSTVSKIVSGQRTVTAYTAQMVATGLNVPTTLVLQEAGLIPKAEKKYKLNPLLESAIQDIAKQNEKKQIIAAKLLRVITED